MRHKSTMSRIQMPPSANRNLKQVNNLSSRNRDTRSPQAGVSHISCMVFRKLGYVRGGCKSVDYKVPQTKSRHSHFSE
jgi:hypothetical protein